MNKEKIGSILEGVQAPNIKPLENLVPTTVVSIEKGSVPSVTLEQRNQVLSGLNEVKQYSEGEIDEQIKEVIVPVFIRAAELARTTRYLELKDKYNDLVDNALTMGWLNGTESDAIKARTEAVKKEKETKVEKEVEDVERKVRAIEAEGNVQDIFQLNGLKSQLNSISTQGLGEQVKDRINSAINEINTKIASMIKKINEEEAKRDESEPGFLKIVFGTKAA